MEELQSFLNERKELKNFLVTSLIYPSIILHMVHNGVTFLILIVIRILMKDESTRALIEQYM